MNTDGTRRFASSSNPTEVSATWQGVGLTLTGLVLQWADTQTGGTLLGGTAAEELAASLVTAVLLVGGVLRTVYGAVRKYVNRQ